MLQRFTPRLRFSLMGLMVFFVPSSLHADLSCHGFLTLLGFVQTHHRQKFSESEMAKAYEDGLRYAVLNLNDSENGIDLTQFKRLTTPLLQSQNLVRCTNSAMITAVMSKVSPRQVTQAMVMGLQLKGMLQSMDPHSDYYPPFDWYRQLAHANSAKAGFSVADNQGNARIRHVYDEGAAAGLLQPGDLLLEVKRHADGKRISMRNASPERLKNALLGEVGSELEITVSRAGKIITVPVTLQEENGSLVSEPKLVEPGVGYFQLMSFGNGAADAFLGAVEDLKQQGARSLVVDLRNNPGGDVVETVKILDALLDRGLAVSFADQQNHLSEHLMTVPGMQTDLPMALLINRYSASAAELLTGSLVDYERGFGVGETTFGKGTAQTIFPPEVLRELTSDDSQDGGLKLTMYQYYTPSGQSPQRVGVTPYWEEVDKQIEADIAQQIAELGAKWEEMIQEGYRVLKGESDFPNALPTMELGYALFQPGSWPTNKMQKILNLFGRSLPVGAIYGDDPVLDRAVELNRAYFNHCIGYHVDQCNFGNSI